MTYSQSIIGDEQPFRNSHHHRDLSFAMDAPMMLYDPHNEVTQRIQDARMSGELADKLLDASNKLFDRVEDLACEREAIMDRVYFEDGFFGNVSGHVLGGRYFPGNETHGTAPELLERYHCEPTPYREKVGKVLDRVLQGAKYVANPLAYPVVRYFDKNSTGTSGDIGAFILFGIPALTIAEAGQMGLSYLVAGPAGLAQPLVGIGAHTAIHFAQKATHNIGIKHRSYRTLQSYVRNDAKLVEALTTVLEGEKNE